MKQSANAVSPGDTGASSFTGFYLYMVIVVAAILLLLALIWGYMRLKRDSEDDDFQSPSEDP
jgi:uncharacterized membrane protein